MKNCLLFLSFFFPVLFLAAFRSCAQSYTDKPMPFLKAQLRSSQPDTNRVKILLALSRALLFKPGAKNTDIDSAGLLAAQAGRLSKQLHDINGQGNTMLMSALLLNHKGKKNDGLLEARMALNLFVKNNEPASQAEALIIIGQHYDSEGKEVDEKISYYEKAVALFLKTGRNERAATTLKDIGDFKTYTKSPVDALKDLQQALAIYQSINYKDLQAVYSLIGENFYSMGDYVNAIKYGLLAAQTATTLGNNGLQLCTTYNRVGLACARAKNFKDARVYLENSYNIARKYNDTSSIQIVAINLTSILASLNQPGSAIQVLNQLEKYAKPGGDPRVEVEIAYRYIKIYFKLNHPDMARKYMEHIVELDSKLGERSEGHEKVYNGIIYYYQQTNQFEKSYYYLIKHAKFCKSNNLSFLTYDDELWWFKADSAAGKYNSAIRHYQRYKAINDSVFNEKRTRQAALLQVQYETDKKDRDIQLKAKDIQLLMKKSQLQKTRSDQDKIIRNVILISMSMLALLLALLYNRYRLKQRSNLLLEAHQSEIDNQNNSLINLNQKQKTLLKEKEWLLREIHHRVKNNLQITMSLLNIQSSYMVNNDALEAIQNSQRRMQAMSLIHQKLYQSENLALIDMSLYIPELINYLKDSFDEVNSLTFDVQTPTLELDIAQAVPIGLILNEAITNSIKYAFPRNHAGRIFISLKEEEFGFFIMTVADNGIGLPETFDGESHNSLGMNLMRGLTEQLEGCFRIFNNGGTIITVSFAGVNMMNEELNLIEQEI